MLASRKTLEEFLNLGCSLDDASLVTSLGQSLGVAVDASDNLACRQESGEFSFDIIPDGVP